MFAFCPDYIANGVKKMGRGDRRSSLKMQRIKGQNKKKARIARALEAAKSAKK